MDWQRLAEEVERQRGRLGYSSRSAFADATHFAEKTLGDIENARRENYGRATMARLETALRWPVGTVAAILAGHPVRPDLNLVPPPTEGFTARPDPSSAGKRPPKLTDRHLFGPGQRDGFRHETKLRAGRVLARLPGVLDGLDEEDMEYAADALEAVEWVLRRRATARYETADDHGRAMTDEEVAAQEARFGGVDTGR